MKPRLWSGVALGLCLCSVGCGSSAADTPKESGILLAYLEEAPELPSEHGNWHRNHRPGADDYGAQFLAMHGHLVMAFDEWRAARGYGRVQAWDPSSPIPESAAHAGRLTDDPAPSCESCTTPSWFTLDGGESVDPHSGARRLSDFESAEQLGRSIDAPGAPAWHSSVHNAIGGDMGDNATAPRDPVFWMFHRTIDDIFRHWLALKAAPYPPAGHDS